MGLPPKSMCCNLFGIRLACRASQPMWQALALYGRHAVLIRANSYNMGGPSYAPPYAHAAGYTAKTGSCMASPYAAAYRKRFAWCMPMLGNNGVCMGCAAFPARASLYGIGGCSIRSHLSYTPSSNVCQCRATIGLHAQQCRRTIPARIPYCGRCPAYTRQICMARAGAYIRSHTHSTDHGPMPTLSPFHAASGLSFPMRHGLSHTRQAMLHSVSFIRRVRQKLAAS